MAEISKILKEKEGVISKIEEIGPSIYKYTIGVEEESMPTLCYAVRLGVPGRTLTRPFSPVKVSSTALECIIKIYPEPADKDHEMFTPYLSNLSVGDVLRVLWYTEKHPITEILCDTNRQVCMLSAGTGITPMMQILQCAQENKNKQSFKVVSVSSNSVYRILKSSDEYAALDLEITDIFIGRNEHSQGSGLSILRERVAQIKSAEERTVYLVCGPDSFVKEVAGDRKGLYGGILHALGIPSSSCIKF
ncbi:cytochrome-b5 reductase [Nematocida minor]|uniref:cytochrome-b5 reductase n=1 Tax=Nematocida minor TaxID=1912983 RepID=UPI002220E590|nr:cytochrome-b5 reductase [Nematocida minor]KAI5192242.1 cytochrome-b5 reductase [Nematocida minor]